MRIDDLLDSSPVLARRAHPQHARTLQRAASAGYVVPVLPGVYARRDLAGEPETRLVAVTAWSPHGVVHARTAIELFCGTRISMPVQLRSPNRAAPVPWLEVTRGQVPPEFRRRYRGVRTATPAYACLEVASTDRGEAAFEFLRRRLVRPAELEAALPAFEGTRGNAERRRVAARAIRNPWSVAEARLQDLLTGAGITGWVANQPLRIGPALLFPDVWFRELGLVVEFDGEASHSDHAQFEGDRWRQNLMVTAGLMVLRITWQMLGETPLRVIQLVQAAIALARSGHRSPGM
ncbi:endonuclease domain-containing protein [Propionicimonas sp.]|uniref:endonuclease domain-containing protein n=1 Tax=Propionicimonas sp. TaxID=1955623 RepID=UPI0039E301FE